MSNFLIDITRNIKDFKHKLDLEPRVILSAGFGDGKTYFLKEFERVYASEYDFFTIYPAQYVIGTNDAIFEYIKRDILFQIVDRGIITEEFDLVGLLRGMMEYVDISEVLSFFLSKPVAKALGNAIEQVKSLVGKVEKSTLSATKYLDSFMSVRGGLYENDAYTCLIRKCFDKMRETDGKQIVLVIEDLDRIDPANIFSILNIFGSHFDRHFIVGTDEQENKFDVDRLITVMDYDNLKSLYNHQYGEDGEGNFEGYISKYICSAPFRYSIRAEARKLLTEKIYALYSFTNPNDIGMKQRLSQDMEKMSIRDLERAFLFDPMKVIRCSDGSLEINGYCLCPQSPILWTQAYSLFFGLSCLSVRATAKSPDDLSEVEAKGPLMVLNEGYNNLTRNLLFNGRPYSIRIENDKEGRLLNIHFRRTTSYSTPYIQGGESSGMYDDVNSGIWTIESQFESLFYYNPEPEDASILDGDYPGEDKYEE